jgi:hypothetical protein
MRSKRIKREIENNSAQLNQLTTHGPIPVTVREYFPEENKVTIQLSSTSETFNRLSLGGTKFPIHAPIHEAIGYGIKPGTPMMLYYSGMQISRGWVLLAYSEGTKDSVTYVPIRHSWAI